MKNEKNSPSLYLANSLSLNNESGFSKRNKCQTSKNKSKIGLALCELDREDINALTNLVTQKIYINLRSPIIHKILTSNPEVQKVLLIEELSHELAHILGYGLKMHDLDFFKKQRILKYEAILNLF